MSIKLSRDHHVI